jgi:DNA-binding transcriptional LysR family regulator
MMVDILPPLIDCFLEGYPDVRGELDVEDRLVDIVASSSDAGIRYGEHLARDTISVPIGPRILRRALAAAPAYLAARGRPSHPRDLVDHDCIRLRFSSSALGAWELGHDGQYLVINSVTRIIAGMDAVPAAIDLALAVRGMLRTLAGPAYG